MSKILIITYTCVILFTVLMLNIPMLTFVQLAVKRDIWKVSIPQDFLFSIDINI